MSGDRPVTRCCYCSRILPAEQLYVLDDFRLICGGCTPPDGLDYGQVRGSIIRFAALVVVAAFAALGASVSLLALALQVLRHG